MQVTARLRENPLDVFLVPLFACILVFVLDVARRAFPPLALVAYGTVKWALSGWGLASVSAASWVLVATSFAMPRADTATVLSVAGRRIGGALLVVSTAGAALLLQLARGLAAAAGAHAAAAWQARKAGQANAAAAAAGGAADAPAVPLPQPPQHQRQHQHQQQYQQASQTGTAQAPHLQPQASPLQPPLSYQAAPSAIHPQSGHTVAAPQGAGPSNWDQYLFVAPHGAPGQLVPLPPPPPPSVSTSAFVAHAAPAPPPPPPPHAQAAVPMNAVSGAALPAAFPSVSTAAAQSAAAAPPPPPPPPHMQAAASAAAAATTVPALSAATAPDEEEEPPQRFLCPITGARLLWYPSLHEIPLTWHDFWHCCCASAAAIVVATVMALLCCTA